MLLGVLGFGLHNSVSWVWMDCGGIEQIFGGRWVLTKDVLWYEEWISSEPHRLCYVYYCIAVALPDFTETSRV